MSNRSNYEALASELASLSNGINQTNLLNAVHVNENVHSRILRLLLEYHSIDGHYPLLESFLRIGKLSDVISPGILSDKPQFYNERDRIDLLIIGKENSFAIVIENKIYNASDQDYQIERYLDSCHNRGVPDKELYAIYLTKDGSKTISDRSLTAAAKSLLGISSESKGRLIEMNYCSDILPWLKGILDSNALEGDQLMYSAVIQYTDYLAWIFGENEGSKDYNNKIMNLLDKYGINKSISSYGECLKVFNDFMYELQKERDRLCAEKAERYISLPLKSYCEENGFEIDEDEYSYCRVSFRIRFPLLSKVSYRFNTEGNGRNIYGICNYNSNDGDVFKVDDNQLGDFKRSWWWPAYKYVDSNGYPAYYRTASDEFWLDNNLIGFFEYIIKTIDEVRSLIDGTQLP